MCPPAPPSPWQSSVPVGRRSFLAPHHGCDAGPLPGLHARSAARVATTSVGGATNHGDRPLGFGVKGHHKRKGALAHNHLVVVVVVVVVGCVVVVVAVVVAVVVVRSPYESVEAAQRVAERLGVKLPASPPPGPQRPRGRRAKNAAFLRRKYPSSEPPQLVEELI